MNCQLCLTSFHVKGKDNSFCVNLQNDFLFGQLKGERKTLVLLFFFISLRLLFV